MKQCISQEQFEELDAKQRDAWLTWTFAKQKASGKIMLYSSPPPYRSIGDLLWFLNDQREGTEKHIEIGTMGTSPTRWYVKIETIKVICSSTELVDALWMAVKKVLSTTES